MDRILLTLALACCFVTNTWAEIDEHCTVSYGGRVTTWTQERSSGVASMLIKPIVFTAIHRTATTAVFEGPVVLQHDSVDLKFFLRNEPGSGCEYVGSTSEDGQGTLRIEVDANGATPVITARLTIETKPREGLIRKCNGNTTTTWYEYWFDQYKYSHEMEQDSFVRPSLESDGSYRGSKYVGQQYRHDSSVWDVEYLTTIDVKIGISPRVILTPSLPGAVFTPSLTMPLIPGIEVPMNFSANLVYGKSTAKLRSATLTARDKRYPMEAIYVTNPRLFWIGDIDVAAEATWQDTGTYVSVRAEMSDGTILDDSCLVSFVKRPFWLADNAVIRRGSTGWKEYVRYDIIHGVPGGSMALPVQKLVTTFYDNDRVQPVFGPACGFGSNVRFSAMGGSFHNVFDWNGLGEPSGVLKLSMDLPDRIEDLSLSVAPKFRIRDRKLEVAYCPASGTEESIIAPRTLGSFYGPLLDSLKPLVNQVEMTSIVDEMIGVQYDVSLYMQAYWGLIAPDKLALVDGPNLFDLQNAIRTMESIEVNDYLTLHTYTKADLSWKAQLTTDSIRSDNVSGGSYQWLAVDALGEFTVVASESANVAWKPTSIVQRSVREDLPAVLLNDNERTFVAYHQPGSAHPS